MTEYLDILMQISSLKNNQQDKEAQQTIQSWEMKNYIQIRNACKIRNIMRHKITNQENKPYYKSFKKG